MNVQTDISKNVKEAPVALKAYGFKIPLMNGGHRIWPPKFKRFIIEGIARGELNAIDVPEKCKVNRSVINLWKNEIEKLDKLENRQESPVHSFTALGFEVLISNDGRRHWPTDLKEYVVSGLANGKLTLKQIAKSCDIERSMIYQWKQDIKRKTYKEAEPAQRPVSSFAEVTVTPEPAIVSTNKKPIILRFNNVVLEIPSDHHAKDIAEIIQELGRSS